MYTFEANLIIGSVPEVVKSEAQQDESRVQQAIAGRHRLSNDGLYLLSVRVFRSYPNLVLLGLQEATTCKREGDGPKC
ncbi:hypothetical protein Mapa_017636 [Marchantia paleacea]|nr:hypothetical protein Mapa_017636 [Marchantia paleacea]